MDTEDTVTILKLAEIEKSSSTIKKRLAEVEPSDTASQRSCGPKP